MSSATLLVVAIVVVVDVAASVLVLRNAVFSRSQRLLQLAFIWSIPFVGAIVCAAFASSHAHGAVSPGAIDPVYLPPDGAPADSPGVAGCDGGDAGACGD